MRPSWTVLSYSSFHNSVLITAISDLPGLPDLLQVLPTFVAHLSVAGSLLLITIGSDAGVLFSSPVFLVQLPASGKASSIPGGTCSLLDLLSALESDLSLQPCPSMQRNARLRKFVVLWSCNGRCGRLLVRLFSLIEVMCNFDPRANFSEESCSDMPPIWPFMVYRISTTLPASIGELWWLLLCYLRLLSASLCSCAPKALDGTCPKDGTLPLTRQCANCGTTKFKLLEICFIWPSF